ncbi:MAG: hypothetical protein JNM39_01895 [Bdellovibrionaceae bacterium]|nr:hypothetical protein [Pseudobdellovibrionaceae bacterium]
MSSILVGAVAASLCFCPMSFAKTKALDHESPKAALTKPMDIRRTVEFLKKFVSADQAYQTMDALVPSLGLARWIQFFKQNNIDLTKLSFNDLRVDGNQVFIPNVKTPFVFSNDQKISYKGVDFKIVKEENPEQTIDRMRRAWGSNSELGFDSPKKTTLFSYFAKEAFADDSQIIREEPFGDAFRLFIALVPFADRFPFLNRLTSGHLVEDLKSKNPKLICDSFKNFKFLMSKTNDLVSPKELTVFYGTEAEVRDALTDVCLKGPQQVKEWNRLFPVVLDKISTGEVHIDKVNLEDPSFNKALPSSK